MSGRGKGGKGLGRLLTVLPASLQSLYTNDIGGNYAIGSLQPIAATMGMQAAPTANYLRGLMLRPKEQNNEIYVSDGAWGFGQSRGFGQYNGENMGDAAAPAPGNFPSLTSQEVQTGKLSLSLDHRHVRVAGQPESGSAENYRHLTLPTFDLQADVANLFGSTRKQLQSD